MGLHKAVGSACLCLATVALPALARSGELSLQRIMLTLGGVGYFEYGALLDGSGAVGIDLTGNQVSDALASLVMLDAAGRVAGVELPGEQGADAAFTLLPFGRAALSSPLALLHGLVGVELQALRRVAELRAAEANRLAERDRPARQRGELDADEARLRQNLAVVPAADAPHAQLIAQLAGAEDRLGSLAEATAAANAAAAQAHAALLDAVADLEF